MSTVYCSVTRSSGVTKSGRGSLNLQLHHAKNPRSAPVDNFDDTHIIIMCVPISHFQLLMIPVCLSSTCTHGDGIAKSFLHILKTNGRLYIATLLTLALMY